MSVHCVLNRLPVELLYHLFGYFYTYEILYTFSDVSDYIKEAALLYFQCYVNFKSIRKTDFHFLCSRLRPDKILSLALSDDIDTPYQSQLFLSQYRLERFKQLQSFTLIHIEHDTLELILSNLYQLHRLRSLSINIDSLSHTHQQFINSQLVNLKLGKCSIGELEAIVQRLSLLKSLDVCLILNRPPLKLHLPCKQLKRLTIKIEGNE